jgi:PKD repeat protein
MAITKIASTDIGYITGQLSLFPEAKDSTSQLYEATNNSQTILTQSLPYNGKYIIVENNDNFPSSGILRIGPSAGESGPAEMVYYQTKTKGIFRDLIRGFTGSRQNPWPIGSFVSNAVFAEHHNAAKDAIIQIETNLGTQDFPSSTSLNGILKTQETRFLAPRPLFRAYPLIGAPPLKVRFQNFSTGTLVRYLWDFGDGTTSLEKSPTHTYLTEGVYSVKLNIISSLGAQGVVTKSNYIVVSNKSKPSFFYITPTQGYSVQTAAERTANGFPTDPTIFNFVDQTDGNVIQRYWIFDGDGSSDNVPIPTQSISESNPNIHTVNYVYNLPKEYQPSLLVVFDDQSLKRATLANKVTVL